MHAYKRYTHIIFLLWWWWDSVMDESMRLSISFFVNMSDDLLACTVYWVHNRYICSRNQPIKKLFWLISENTLCGNYYFFSFCFLYQHIYFQNGNLNETLTHKHFGRKIFWWNNKKVFLIYYIPVTDFFE